MWLCNETTDEHRLNQKDGFMKTICVNLRSSVVKIPFQPF